MISIETFKQLIRKKNVNGCGYGVQRKDGKRIGDGLVITVNKKVDVKDLDRKDIIPREIEGNATDVIEIGDIKALDIDRTKRYRPSPMGISSGHYMVTAGTMGGMVKDKYGNICVLSNNHVFANGNDANIGDPILQPGKYDGGIVGADVLLTLRDFEKIKYTYCAMVDKVTKAMNTMASLLGSSVVIDYSYGGISSKKMNYMDAAIATPKNINDIISEYMELPKIKGVNYEIKLGQVLTKEGRTTGVSSGDIQLMSWTGQVGYGQDKLAIFADQVICNARYQDPFLFSKGGDSGSWVRNSDNELVGLLFAGSDAVTIINKIKYPLERFGVTPVL